jgi:hypothetical protein
MYLVADLEDDQEHYYDTIINITHLRNLQGDEESINIAYNEYKKNFKKTVDPDVNLGHNNLKQFGAATVAPSGCSVITVCQSGSALKAKRQEAINLWEPMQQRREAQAASAE